MGLARRASAMNAILFCQYPMKNSTKDKRANKVTVKLRIEEAMDVMKAVSPSSNRTIKMAGGQRDSQRSLDYGIFLLIMLFVPGWSAAVSSSATDHPASA